MDTAAEDLRLLLRWIDDFPESEHGPLWLKAFETGYQEELIAKLQSNVGKLDGAFLEPGPSNETSGQAQFDGVARPEKTAKGAPVTVRPQAQAVFCIDVRSESLRRHLEALGDYETFGFAGFFNAAIRYQALGSHHETDQFPVILKAKNVVREIPRTYQGQVHLKHQRPDAENRRRARLAARPQRKRRHALCHGRVSRLVLQPANDRQNDFHQLLCERERLVQTHFLASGGHHPDRRQAFAG